MMARMIILATLLAMASPALATDKPDAADVARLFESWKRAEKAPPAPAPDRPKNGVVPMTSDMGWRRNPVLGRILYHSGVDLAARAGMAIYATADGTVTRAAATGSYGLLVIMQHRGGYETRYAHMAAIHVKPGQILRKGALIGYVGSTGRSTGPHLHYEVRLHGQAVDPKPYMRPSPAASSQPPRVDERRTLSVRSGNYAQVR